MITPAQLEAVRQLGTPIVADALETFDLRLRNQGYTRPGLHCLTGDYPPVIGYAATVRVRSGDPPVLGNSYLAHDDWWRDISRSPQPRIAVLEDIDPHPGVGACVGIVAATMYQALGCGAVITNGSVRDLEEIALMRLPLLAAHVCPSHSYAHVVDHSRPVDIFGLVIKAGDLLLADRHGVVSVPATLVPDIPAVALDLLRRKRRFAEFCRSPEFSLERLAAEVKQLIP